MVGNKHRPIGNTTTQTLVFSIKFRICWFCWTCQEPYPKRYLSCRGDQINCKYECSRESDNPLRSSSNKDVLGTTAIFITIRLFSGGRDDLNLYGFRCSLDTFAVVRFYPNQVISESDLPCLESVKPIPMSHYSPIISVPEN